MRSFLFFCLKSEAKENKDAGYFCEAISDFSFVLFVLQELQDKMSTSAAAFSTAERQSEQRGAELKAALVSLLNIQRSENQSIRMIDRTFIVKLTMFHLS